MKLVRSSPAVLRVVAPPTTTKTHCPYCAFQCGMTITAHDDGEHDRAAPELSVRADPDFPVNRGQMCIKGFTSSALLDPSLRIRAPKLRLASGKLAAVKWDVALDFIADKLRSLRERHGAEALAAIGGAALTNEQAYLIRKLARVVLGSSNADCTGGYGTAPAPAGQLRAFGLDRGLPFPVADLAQAETLMLWGSSCADTMPPIMQWIVEQKNRGGQLIVVDPRRTDTARAATLHLQCTPGTDLALANGLLHLAIEERLIDLEYIAERTEGFDDVRRSVLAIKPAHVERLTGVSIDRQLSAVRMLAGATRSMTLSGRGAEPPARGTDTALALINLMLALGKVGKPASGYGCVAGEGDGQGGREPGQVALDPRAGVRGLLVFGANIAAPSPSGRSIEHRSSALDLLVVCDAFESESSAAAHVVLPTAQWAEQEGTMTNLEGRVILRQAVRPPPQGVKTDIEVICGLAERLGHREAFAFSSPRDVFEELRSATRGGDADQSGISYEKLRAQQGVFWPCPSEDHPGTPRLFAERFAHPSGRARFHAVPYRSAAEVPDSEYPLYFATGRYREHPSSGAATRRVAPRAEGRPEPRVQMHPQLAERLGVLDGAGVLVESRRGSICFKALISSDIRPDTLFAPLHWGGQHAANALASSALDPISRMPDFKICAVRARAAEQIV